MSITFPKLILNMGLTPSEIGVYLHLLDMADEDGVCDYTIMEFSRKTKVTSPTFIRIKSSLEVIGLISINNRKKYMTQPITILNYSA